MLCDNRILEIQTLPTFKKGFHNEDCKNMIYKPFGNTGLCTSLLGFGGAELALVYDTNKEEDGIDTVITGIKNGINYIDTAPYYGQGKAEIVLGKALKQIPRNTYYLATKIGRYGPDVSNLFDFSADRTFKSVNESLIRLGVEYFDILQVHDLEFAPSMDVIVNETLPALQKLKDMGKVKHIGITGYPLSKLKEVLERSSIPIDVVLSYCRCTLFDDSLSHYIPYFKEKELGIVNAASLGMGLLTTRGPPEWHPASQELRDMCKKAVEFCQENSVNISKIAFWHSLSTAKDAHVHLIGMENKEVLRANLETLWTGLSDHELSVKQDMMKMFTCLKETHWENFELDKYHKAIANAVQCQNNCK